MNEKYNYEIESFPLNKIDKNGTNEATVDDCDNDFLACSDNI